MPRIPEQKRPDIDWASMSDKIGDFLVDKIWGGPANEDYFKEKYGDEWRSNYDKTERNVRSLYGLLPAKNASQTAVALEALTYAIPALGSLVSVYHGQQAGLSLYQMIRRGKWVGGGEYPIGQHARPWYGAEKRAEAATYPRDLSQGQELFKLKISEENIRKHADAMEQFRRGGALGVPQWRYSYRRGMEVPKRESELHTVYSEGVPVSDIEEVGKWTDIRFSEDPISYFDRTGRFLDPEVGGWQDLTELMRDF